MSTYTENYNLIKPDETDYYDVQNFNENMDVIDTQMMETTQEIENISEKIGIPTTEGNTVFSLLENSNGLSIKSIQRVFYGIAQSTTSGSVSIKTVDPEKCIVIFERLTNSSSGLIAVDYTLTTESIDITHGTTGTGTFRFGFWIIEFN